MKQFLFNTHDLTALFTPQHFQAQPSTIEDLSQRLGAPVEAFNLRAQATPATPKNYAYITLAIHAQISLTCIYSKKKFPFLYEKTHSIFLHHTPFDDDSNDELIEHLQVEEENIDLLEIATQYVIMGVPDHPQINSYKPENTSDYSSEHKTTSPFDSLKNLFGSTD